MLQKQWIYDGQLRPVAELNASGTVTATFVYATHINIPDYIIKSGVTYRVITDHLGSLRFVINTSTGAIAQRMDYDDWGNVLVNTAPDFTPFGFAGGLYDSQTKLTRFGARDYDAEVGRWTCKDIVGFKSTQTNFYEFCFNDCVNVYDPSGLAGCVADCIKITRKVLEAHKQFQKSLALVSAVSAAGAGALLGGKIGLVFAGIGVAPGAAVGGAVGALLGYFGVWEGYYGFEWAIAKAGEKAKFAMCVKECGLCDEKLISDIFESVYSEYF
jgi:RHS repeat-associated protein